MPDLPTTGRWTPELSERAGELRWLLLDVDGVLTDGRLWFGEQGEVLKPFDVRDGLGIQLLRQNGVDVGILSARMSPTVAARAAGLGIDEVLQGEADKEAAFVAFLERRGVAAGQVAYLADDLQDLRVLGRCGLSAAPADAVAEVRSRVRYVTAAAGGRGAVRELAERILSARGDWQAILAAYSGEVETADS
ncbi:MAG: KdsC family phosphatase [Thermoanaerobaculia bacterium]